MIIFVLTVFIVGYFAYIYRSNFFIINRLNASEIGILILIPMLASLVQAFQLNNIIYYSSNKGNILKTYAITAISSLYNNIIPLAGGAVVRAGMIKRIYQVNWQDLSIIVAGYYLLSYISMIAMLDIIALVAYYDNIISINILIYLVVASLGLATLIAVMRLRNSTFKNRGRIRKFLSNAVSGLNSLFRANLLVLNISVQQVMIVLLSGIKLYLCFYYLSLDTNLLKVLMVQSFVSLSLIFTISPGNLGIQEGIYLFFSGFLSLAKEDMLVAALLFRVTNIIGIVIIGMLSKIWLSRHG